MPIKVNASQFADKWRRRTQGATQDYVDGINRVTQAPGEMAAARKDAYVQGVMANEDKWATNVAAIPLGTWKSDAINKGAPRIAAGVQQAESKVQRFAAALIDYEENALNTLNSQMPRGDFAQNVQRMVAWSEMMHNFKKPTGT